jgi:hypothetical protein
MSSMQQNGRRLTLSYRSVLDEQSGPTGLEVLGGVCCLLFCLVALASGLAILALTVGLLLGVTGILGGPKASGTAPRTSAIAPAIMGGILLWSTIVLFRLACRLFAGRPGGQRSRRFTYRSHLALVLANQRALGDGARALDGGHILLGLLDSAPNTAATVLSGLKVDIAALRARLGGGLPLPEEAAAGDLPILSPTPQCVRIVTRAVQLGFSENPGPVGTEHFLLALLAEAAGLADGMLRDAGVSETAVAAEVERLQVAYPAGMTPEALEPEPGVHE